MINQKRLKELFKYDSETGIFTRLVSRNNKYRIGSVAGSAQHGYVQIQIDRHTYKAHRLAWLYMTGKYPENVIDHIDGNGMNNCWKNLRDVSHSCNQQNQKCARSNNQVGLLGVSFKKDRGKFRSTIKVNGKYIHLGYFDTAQDAHNKYVSVKRKIHFGCTI